jgi:ribosomal protein S11
VAPRFANSREIRERVNNVQLMADKGLIDDPAFMRALREAEKGVELSEVGGDYFEPIVNYKVDKDGNKKYLGKGKVNLEPVERAHGLGQSPTSMRAILAQERLKRTGFSAFAPPPIEGEIKRIEQILRESVSATSYGKIGMGGARGNRTPEQKLGVAASLLADVNRGYNRETGIAFNGVALDAGHRVAHSANPLLSDEPSNLIMQNQYMNKGQAAVEKMAFQQGREATDEELAQGLWKSWVNKIMDGAPLLTDGMRKNSTKYREVMSAVNAKI